MPVHRELAALVRQAGPGVLLDANEFRAVFDDFVPEGAATEGDINLLTDAIRLGALGRVLAQIGQGADAGLAIESQGLRLAQQRGTQEAAGAQWALAVLTFAHGDLEERLLLTRFPAPSDSLRRPEFLEVLPTVAPRRTPAMPPGPPPPPPRQPTEILAQPATAVPVTAAPRMTSPLPPPFQVAARPRGRRRHPLRWAVAVAVVGAVAGATFVVLNRGDDPTGEPGTDTSTSPDLPTVATGSLFATDGATPPVVDEQLVMAGRTGGVRVTALGAVDRVGSGDGAKVAAAGEQLIAFTLEKGPCQDEPCRAVRQLALKVLVDGEPAKLPGGGPTFVVAARDDASVELQYDADGFDQRISLLDGTSTGKNIEVLTRSDRTGKVIGGPKYIQPTSTRYTIPSTARRTVNPRRADLVFFVGRRTPARADQAFLRIDVRYTKPGEPDPYITYPEYVSVLAPDGTPYDELNLGTAAKPDVVYLVPADFRRGTLVYEGTRSVTDSRLGTSYPLTLPRTAFPIRY